MAHRRKRKRARIAPEVIEAARTPEELVDLLFRVGKELPDHLARRILELGAAAVGPLVAILCDENTYAKDGPGSGWAPIHSAEVLGELQSADAVEALLDVLRKTDFEDLLHNSAMLALPKLGGAVLEPALAALSTADDEDHVMALCGVLSELGVNDDRVYAALLQRVEEDPGSAGMLAEYGDPRAVEFLARLLDAYPVSDSDGFIATQDVIELVDAIERLGGSLSPTQTRKYQYVHRRRREWANEARARQSRDERSSARNSKIGRNAPCPCGSGQKYKRCHGRPTGH